MQTYQGSCHCGQIKFTVKTNTTFSTQCDCSYCRRRGAIILRCDEKDLEIVAGRDDLQLYQFGTHDAQHYFCSQCGIHTFYRLKKLPDKFGINSGCLDEVDLAGLNPVFTKNRKS